MQNLDVNGILAAIATVVGEPDEFSKADVLKMLAIAATAIDYLAHRQTAPKGDVADETAPGTT